MSDYFELKVGLGAILALGLYFVDAVQQNRKYRDLQEAFLYMSEQVVSKDDQPVSRDIDSDGDSDLVLKLMSGENFVLYKTENGYEFGSE